MFIRENYTDCKWFNALFADVLVYIFNIAHSLLVV